MVDIAGSKLTVQLYTPHPGQMTLHECSARFRVMACGRRFGKTLAATNELAKAALEKPSSLNWWIAPTYRQTEIAFNLLSSALAPVTVEKPNKSKMRLDLINGSTIECRSAERYENMRGDGPAFAVFDEASKTPKAAWTEVVRPALADTQGRAIFISTPWGRDWFWELFMRGQRPDEPDYWSKSFPTSANPFIPKEEIEEARRTLPYHVFAQEFEAVFLDDAATVYRGIEACAIGALAEPKMGHFYVVGWDVAKYQDYSVFTVIDCNTGQVVAWERFNGIEYQRQIARLAALTQRYNNAHVVMDVTGVGDPILEEVRAQNISVEGYYFTNTSKKELIDRSVVAIERQLVHFPRIDVLLNELKAYSYEITKSRNIIYGAPDGEHDDCVISLALAIYGAKIGSALPFLISTKAEIHEGPPVPVVQEVDDAFLMERQRLMARSLNLLGSKASYNVQTIDPNDMWGIA